MIFEDAHWIDPTSRELLDLILDRFGEPNALISRVDPGLRVGYCSAGTRGDGESDGFGTLSDAIRRIASAF